MNGHRASPVIIALVLATSSLAAQPGTAGIEAVTLPSADVTLSFIQPGRIIKVLYEEGQTVDVNAVLVRQDDAVEQVRLKQIKAQSENTSQVEASKASLNQKKLDYEKVVWAADHGAATPQEVEHAKLQVTIAELSLEVAKFEHEQSKLKYAEEQIRIDNMALKSPIAGKVEKIHVEVGESVNALTEVIQIVRIDPLWIDVHVPTEQARTLKAGTKAQVQFPGSPAVVSAGRIIFVGAVADAASNTLRARVEVPNTADRPAGEHVVVTIPGVSQNSDVDGKVQQ